MNTLKLAYLTIVIGIVGLIAMAINGDLLWMLALAPLVGAQTFVAYKVKKEGI